MSTGVKISALPTTASLMSSDIFPLVTGGVTRRAAFSMLPFSPMGSGATLRTMPSKVIEIVSVTDYTTPQAAINANPGKAIYFPPGTHAPVVVSTDGTHLYGAGPASSYIVTTSLTGHGAMFYPNNTATRTTFLNNCGIADLSVYSAADKTAGAGVYALQCNGFRLHNVQIQNHPEGCLVSGGQLNVFDKLTVFASSAVLTGTPVANSQALRFTEAPIDGGLYQECFTCEVSNLIIGASRVLDKGIRIESADGLHFTNGYINGAYSDEVFINCVTANRYIGGVRFNTVYIDGVSMTVAPTNRNGVNIPASALGTVYDITFNDCLIGNYTGKGCVVGEGLQQLTFTGGTKFVNIDNWALDFVGDNSTSELKVEGCSFRDVGEVTVSTGGIRASTMLNCIVTGNTFTSIGNTGATAVSLVGTNANGQFANNAYSGCTNNITNGATWTGNISGVPVTWTPAISFATPGNSSFAYSVQFGEYIRDGNTVKADFLLTTSTFTHTTASGNLQVSLPINVKTLTNYGAHCAVLWSGVTKANYTSIVARALSGADLMTFVASGSAQAAGALQASDLPTGGSVILRGTMVYECVP